MYCCITDFPALDHIVPSATPATQAAAVTTLIKRLVPQHAAQFTVSVDPSIGPKFKDTFKVCNDTRQFMLVVEFYA